MSDADFHFMIDYQCILQGLDLFAETCLHRNRRNQKRLTEFFDNKVLIAIFKDTRMNYGIRSRALKLYLEACLDIDPFQKLQVPSGQAVWRELPQLDFSGPELIEAVHDRRQDFSIKCSKSRIPNRILDLKQFMEMFLKSLNGMMEPPGANSEKNEMAI